MQIHYFQRYHNKENVDTSNTLLMLSRLYNYNSDKFFSMINSLILDDNDSPEINFELQVGGKNSVPDAVISQRSFKIVIETKLHNQFNDSQLINHLEQFGNEDIKVLLTLDPKLMDAIRKKSFEEKLYEYNLNNKGTTKIKHINLTFENLVNAMEDIVDDRDIEIIDILEDYKKYCLEEKLIPDGYKHMRAFSSISTFDDNMELSLYYRNVKDNLSEFGYIGLYNNKIIKAIGKVLKIIIVKEINGKTQYISEKGNEVTDNDIQNIDEAVKRAQERGDDLRKDECRYFIVDKFYRTEFKKTSKGGLFGSKDFNILETCGYKEMPDTSQIANDLYNYSWT